MLLALVNLVLSVWNTVFRGLVIKIFWGWFLLPLFPSLPVLTVLYAVGLSYTVGIFTPMKGLTSKELEEIKDSTSESRGALNAINGALLSVAIGFTLLGGYILHCFM
jgi:hypothetical protein